MVQGQSLISATDLMIDFGLGWPFITILWLVTRDQILKACHQRTLWRFVKIITKWSQNVIIYSSERFWLLNYHVWPSMIFQRHQKFPNNLWFGTVHARKSLSVSRCHQVTLSRPWSGPKSGSSTCFGSRIPGFDQGFVSNFVVENLGHGLKWSKLN